MLRMTDRLTDRLISSKHTPSFARGIATATVNMLLRGERNKTSDRGINHMFILLWLNRSMCAYADDMYLRKTS